MEPTKEGKGADCKFTLETKVCLAKNQTMLGLSEDDYGIVKDQYEGQKMTFHKVLEMFGPTWVAAYKKIEENPKFKELYCKRYTELLRKIDLR